MGNVDSQEFIPHIFSDFVVLLFFEDPSKAGKLPQLPTAPKPCRCGSQSCRPPDPVCCTMRSCCSPSIEEVKFSKKYSMWTANCVTSSAHVSVYDGGMWCGDGCHRGIRKVGHVWNVFIYLEFMGVNLPQALDLLRADRVKQIQKQLQATE